MMTYRGKKLGDIWVSQDHPQEQVYKLLSGYGMVDGVHPSLVRTMATMILGFIDAEVGHPMAVYETDVDRVVTQIRNDLAKMEGW
jgi:hypothetical protein